MENINSKSFRIVTTMMKVIGWYPRNNQNTTLFALQGYILYFVFLVLFLILLIFDIVDRKDYDAMQIIYGAEIANYCFKVLPFLNKTKRHNIVRCINYFNGSDFTPKDEVEKKILEQCVKLCQTITIIFVTGVLSAIALYMLPAVVKDYELPLKIWLPYDPSSGPLIYYSTLCYIIIACLYDACSTCLVDPLLGGLIYQAVTQLKILKYRVLHLQSFVDNTPRISDKRIRKKIKKCVEHHMVILRFVNEYEDCFSWVIFCQFLGTTIVLGFCCIALIELPLTSIEGVKYPPIFFVVSSQVLFYCFFGTLLYEENNTLITTIYSSTWYEYEVRTKKMLIMFMELAKQPMVLTAGKVIDLTLETFVTVLKRSYSLVAVLK